MEKAFTNKSLWVFFGDFSIIFKILTKLNNLRVFKYIGAAQPISKSPMLLRVKINTRPRRIVKKKG